MKKKLNKGLITMEKEKKKNQQNAPMFFILNFIFSSRRSRDTIENKFFLFNLRILRILDLKFTIFLSHIFVASWKIEINHENSTNKTFVFGGENIRLYIFSRVTQCHIHSLTHSTVHSDTYKSNFPHLSQHHTSRILYLC